MLKTYPLYLGGKPSSPNASLAVTDKFSGKVVCHVAQADSKIIDEAIAHAVKAAPAMARLASFERREILAKVGEGLAKRKDELVEILCVEAGKPRRDAEIEVGRLLETFRTAAEESVRLYGEVIPLDFNERTRGYRGQWKRFPVGPCSFISPFNFPLNLVAHKVAPAIAAGCPFVLKPASLTPVSSLVLGEVMSRAGLPEGAFSILPTPREGAELFTTDERLKLLSFTGSPAVGWDLKARAGKKKVVLELGGNAACIVNDDWPVEDAVARVLVGGFGQSGQSCISVQRVLVHTRIYDAFRDSLVEKVRGLKSGDPALAETQIGPLISEKEAARLEKWMVSARESGARVLCGGRRQGTMMEPTVMENVAAAEPLCAEEAFGPVVVLSRFSDFGAALETANASKFGLQAGVFTRDIYRAMQAWETLEVGGVVVGDVPSFRSDPMPYGGVKDSGLGREGLRFAIQDYTEVRMLILRNPE